MIFDRPYVDQPVLATTAADGVARAAAEAWDLPAPTFLRQGMNVIYTCGDEVLRVGLATAPAAASHELATTLVDCGVPVVPPVAGHAADIDGFAVTGWVRIEATSKSVDWVAVGAAVAQIHAIGPDQLPPDYPLPSPTTFPWWDFEALLTSVADRIDDAALDGLRQAIEAGAQWRDRVDESAVVCHGDVHPGNVLMTDEGPLLIDFDLLCAAAPAWDHAMLTTYAERWGGDPGAYDAFASGYGRSFAHDEATLMVASLRNVASTLMRVRAGLADERALGEADRRLRYWRGDPEAPTWNAQ